MLQDTGSGLNDANPGHFIPELDSLVADTGANLMNSTGNVDGTTDNNQSDQSPTAKSPQAGTICDSVLPSHVAHNFQTNPISNSHTPLLSSDTARDHENITDIEESAIPDDEQAQGSTANPDEGNVSDSGNEEYNGNELVSDFEILSKAREAYNNTAVASREYYFVDQKWLKTFLDGEFNLDSFIFQRDLGPVQTFGPDSPAKLTISDFIPFEKMQLLVNAFGLQSGHGYLVRYLVYSVDKQKDILDLNPLTIVPHIFCEKPNQVNRYSNIQRHSNELMISSHMTGFDLYNQVLHFFNLPDVNISDARIWKVEFETSHIAPVIVPSSLKRIKNRKVISKKRLRKNSLKRLRVHSGHLLLELRNSDGLYPLDLDSHVILGSGLVGLNNLGNTCYMNSALQCLLHISELNEYFLYHFYEKEINRDNPLGNSGKVAISFGNLVSSTFDHKHAGNQSSFSPRDFKMTIGHFNSLFADYHQQDSQEFIAYLLDGLHEDLNRVLKKPYVEKPELEEGREDDYEAVKELAQKCWDTHKLRNNSVIVDLFVALYKSTLVCPECSRVSITFDPYNDLTLPLPIKTKWSHMIKILPESGRPKIMEVQLPKGSLYSDLKQYLSKYTGIPVEELVGFDIFKNFVYKNFEEADSDSRYMPISELIDRNDDIWFYQVKRRENDSVHAVYTTTSSGNNSSSIVIPFFITLTPEERCSYGAITTKLNAKYSQLSTSPVFEQLAEAEYGKHSYSEFEHIDIILDRINLELPASGKCNDSDDTSDSSSIISYADPNLCSEILFHSAILDSAMDHAVYNRYAKNNGMNRGSDTSAGFWLPQNSNSILKKDLPKLWESLPNYKQCFYFYTPSGVEDLRSNNDDETSEMNENRQSKDAENDATPETEDLNSIISNNSPISNEMGSAKLGSDEYDEVISNDESFPDKRDVSEIEDENLIEKLMVDDEEEDDVKDVHTDGIVADDDGIEIDSFHTATCDKDVSDESSAISSSIKADPGKKPERVKCEKVEKRPLLGPMTAIVNEFEYENFELLFRDGSDDAKSGLETWTNPEIVVNDELIEEKKRNAENAKKPVTVYDCLEQFSKQEVLGQNDLWYCPKCKDHRQATKKIELWSAPDILTIHLKRFENTRSFSDKIDIVVDFPIEGLDLTKYISDDGGEHIYDLFAVDNHYGGLGGGHYTAYVKNFVDQKWYYYDDSRVTSVADPKAAIKGSAYLLFYRKRSDKPLGGDFFSKMGDEIRKRREELQKVIEAQHNEVTTFTHLETSDEEMLNSPDDGGNVNATGDVTDKEDGDASTDMDVDDANKRRKLVHSDSSENLSVNGSQHLTARSSEEDVVPNHSGTIGGNSNSDATN